MKYLSQIREDAINGRAPSYIDYGIAGGSGDAQTLVGKNKSLQKFLARARGVVVKSSEDSSMASSEEEEEKDEEEQDIVPNTLRAVARPGKV